MRSTVGSFYEFFAGAGMARAGLGDHWRCLLANDFNRKKATTYALNWGEKGFQCGDAQNVTTQDLPEVAGLVWASFPCQDLSLAGGGGGLNGERSGTFWPFWNLVTVLGDEGRAPCMIALENVCGTLTPHNGDDFRAICGALCDGDYRIGALVIDAVHFVPQSRPRLVIIAVRNGVPLPGAICGDEPAEEFCPPALRKAFDNLPPDLRESWIWWHVPNPPARNTDFSDLIEEIQKMLFCIHPRKHRSFLA